VAKTGGHAYLHADGSARSRAKRQTDFKETSMTPGDVRAATTETVDPRAGSPAEAPAPCAPVSTRQALLRGLRGRCPCCGKGRLFRAFLKVADRCDVCGEELHHHQADDFPAYVVIVIVGHIIVPLVLLVETHFAPATWVHLLLWLPLTIGLSLALIQPVKGVVVALQWAFGMHGFEAAKERRDLAAGTLHIRGA
jgi:uncharacterized protein (DUF983 family)